MRRNAPTISIARVMDFTCSSLPDKEVYEISAMIDTLDEISDLGRIRLEEREDLVMLWKILGSYITLHGLKADNRDTDKKEGGEL